MGVPGGKGGPLFGLASGTTRCAGTSVEGAGVVRVGIGGMGPPVVFIGPALEAGIALGTVT